MRIDLRIENDAGRTVYQSRSGEVRVSDGSLIAALRALPDKTIETMARWFLAQAGPTDAD